MYSVIFANRALRYALTGLVALSVFALVSLRQAAPAQAAPCTDVMVLGARGSGQPAAGSAADGGTGLGREVFGVYQSISQARPDRSVSAIALRYPALRAELLINDPTRYFAGLEKGVATAKKVLAKQARACPQQRFVLAGYSQGAMVMHRVLQDLSTGSHARPGLVGRIDGAVLLADGDRMANDNLTSVGSAAGGAGISYADTSIAHPRGRRLPAPLAARVVSVCEQADIICDFRVPWQANDAGVDGTTVHVGSYTGSANAKRAAELVATQIR